MRTDLIQVTEQMPPMMETVIGKSDEFMDDRLYLCYWWQSTAPGQPVRWYLDLTHYPHLDVPMMQIPDIVAWMPQSLKQMEIFDDDQK